MREDHKKFIEKYHRQKEKETQLSVTVVRIIYYTGLWVDIAVAIYAFVFSFLWIYRIFGFWGILANIILFPLTSCIAPIHHWYKSGSYWPTLIIVLGLIIGGYLQHRAKKMSWPAHPLGREL